MLLTLVGTQQPEAHAEVKGYEPMEVGRAHLLLY